MEKTGAVAAFGRTQLLRPAQIKAALAANDRLKFYLTVVQAAWTHAANGHGDAPDLRREYAAAQLEAPWLLDMPGAGRLDGTVLHLDGFDRIAKQLAADLRRMGEPLDGEAAAPLRSRVETWCDWLDHLDPDRIASHQLDRLTSGRREVGDSLHILVMDLHKAINRLAADIAEELVEGARVWQLDPADRSRVVAFMHGLNRTRLLKLDHPGLDTAATRDGERLLIQNDIGTNDAHVLVIQVEGLRLSLTYSDLHPQRFAFFQALLVEDGATWSGVSARTTPGLNAGGAYQVGTAVFDCDDEVGLLQALERLGAHIVFLIDWNRARKRLRLLLGKRGAAALLTESARSGIGHMGWLEAGGAQLLFGAMEAVGSEHFRIGDRLDTVLGEEQARAFMLEALSACHEAMEQRQPLPRIADSIRLLLLRHVGRQQDAFGLLSEHAAFCSELAEGIRDALAYGWEREAAAAAEFARRAKRWERQADMLVMRSRERAERSQGWVPFTRAIERADDIADALEEGAFLLSLISEGHHRGWNGEIRDRLFQLANRACEAVHDHVRALAIAGILRDGGTAEDHEAFLAVSWRAAEAEQQCDDLLREVRSAAARHLDDPVTLALTSELAQAIEAATDALLGTSYGVRELAFSRIGGHR
ncbi:hypothetical protein STAQ_24200 [Allostella sp. ATCC 35155]|nr:hypothetical protein STAQ_24200 [Stella sp. ATCC 35155]